MYKIMIIEDEEKIANIIKKSLEKWGFETYIVKDFNAIFQEFLHINPQLVLMDVNLPAYDGFYWCSKIRSMSKVPVIFLSSRSTNMDIVMAVNMGGDDYITKPFSIEVLNAKINAILRRTYSYRDSNMDVLHCKGAMLSLKDNILYYQDKTIELTRNEFKILYILMKEYETIVSREDIMQELWQDENFIDDNTLTVNINRLRKKLNKIGLNDFIKTIINQGYVIK
ncbi:TPA: response regulator transcription factor [Clostridium botulinum]|uniref:response regulator transcription factor n=1 Tax=Clostridium TaxID=1485 RepID=UPI0007736446|nr:MULTISPECIES: response regulator transcription factor [Clostridium]AUM95444.1 DNA-binding response regulator [Clostridium sporogenes]AVQ52885.1 DNA-binding response regulator [Clostridium botulinum]EKO1911487.1 response regulator transcription factor [Clostridium botulinum]EKO2041548.1 response regulator transcription factor [Clostridium botulinum]MBU5298577.1 response regulator transcription factor [Clostridium sporogenes]